MSLLILKCKLKKISIPDHKSSSLQFKLKGEHTIEFFFTNGALYLKEIWSDKHRFTYDFMKYKLNFPLPAKASILSATKVANQVKLCIEQEGKTRVVYFSPHHVDMQKCNVKHLSHKPAQNFYSGTGADPHEKVHSGQPFDSEKLGNFSEANIPFVSSLLGQFRGEFEKSQKRPFRGR
ncbi:hypothetical protein ABK905_15300 [Acerihabitans sp. KWT182]|uniref:Uncharacterized protein n=1 Tax=Acerihabitans sp. KWT182 TaxID=3157919 RepID=A0AAU7Q5G1_9GAMM